MKKSIYPYVFLAAALMMSLVSACASQTQQPGSLDEPGENFPGLPNPAAVYCEGQGYALENVTREGGEDADCIFPDGSRCPMWDFFHGRCGEDFTYCSTQGYSLEIENDLAYCRFPDGSYCVEYLYFSGECSPGDNPGMADEDKIDIET